MFFKPLSFSIALKMMFSKNKDQNFYIFLFSFVGIIISTFILIFTFLFIDILSENTKKYIFNNTPHIVLKEATKSIPKENIINNIEYNSFEGFVNIGNKVELINIVTVSKKDFKILFKNNSNEEIEKFYKHKRQVALSNRLLQELINDQSVQRVLYKENKQALNSGYKFRITNFKNIKYTPFGELPTSLLLYSSNIKLTNFKYFSNVIIVNEEIFRKLTNNKEKNIYNKKLTLKNPENIKDYKIKESKIVTSWIDEYYGLYLSLKMENYITKSFVFFIMIIAFINSFSATKIIINSKRKDIAIIRMLGISNNTIYLTFLIQMLIKTITGIIIANILVYFLITNFVDILRLFEYSDIRLYSLEYDIEKIININIGLLLFHSLLSIFMVKIPLKKEPIRELSHE